MQHDLYRFRFFNLRVDLFTVTLAGAVRGFSLEKQGLATCQGPIPNTKTEAENP